MNMKCNKERNLKLNSSHFLRPSVVSCFPLPQMCHLSFTSESTTSQKCSLLCVDVSVALQWHFTAMQCTPFLCDRSAPFSLPDSVHAIAFHLACLRDVVSRQSSIYPFSIANRFPLLSFPNLDVDVGCFEGVEEEEADDIGHHQGHGRFGGAASSANGHRRHSQATDAFEDSSQPSTTSSSPHQNQNENNIPLTSKSPGSSSRPHLLRELLETESAYLSDLRVLVGAFRGPLFGAKALSARESSLVFGNVDQLIALHTQLLVRDMRHHLGLIVA